MNYDTFVLANKNLEVIIEGIWCWRIKWNTLLKLSKALITHETLTHSAEETVIPIIKDSSGKTIFLTQHIELRKKWEKLLDNLKLSEIIPTSV